LIHEEIKSSLNLENVSYLSVQNLLLSHLLSKDINIKMLNTLVLPVVLYGSEIWSQILREEHGLRMLECRVLRRIFGPKRD
jgi:hypothetical protein